MNVTSIVFLSLVILNVGVGIAGDKKVPKAPDNISAADFEILRINTTKKRLNSVVAVKRNDAMDSIGTIGVDAIEPRVKLAAMRALKGKVSTKITADGYRSRRHVVNIAKSTNNAGVHRLAIDMLSPKLARVWVSTEKIRDQITEIALWSGDATTKRNAILALGTTDISNAEIKKITDSLNAMTRQSTRDIQKPTHKN